MMKPHISDLRIEAFRGLKSIELKSLGQINLFVGFNNSGKSSILEAIEYFCKPADPLALINLSRRRELSARTPDPVHTVRWLFPKDSAVPDGDFIELVISVSGTIEGVRKIIETTSHFRLADVYVSPTIDADESEPEQVAPPTATETLESNYQKKTVDLRFLYYEDTAPDAIIKFNTSGYTFVEGIPFRMYKAVEVPAIPCSVISPVTHRIDSSQTKGISTAIRGKQKNEIIEVVQLFDPEIKDIVILDGGGYPEVWIDHAIRGFMPLTGFGDGLRRILVIAGKLTSAQNGVLLIDEIETAIHNAVFFKSFQWLVRTANRLNVQVFATTHSLEAVDAFLGVSGKREIDLVTFQLSGNTPGASLVKRFDEDTLLSIRTELGGDVR